jgi:hypothetical protein
VLDASVPRPNQQQPTIPQQKSAILSGVTVAAPKSNPSMDAMNMYNAIPKDVSV